MNEAAFWQHIRTKMRNCWDATRIESDTGLGIPDVSYGVPTGQGWIELKYLAGFPKREDSPVKMCHFTTQQKMWLKRRGRIAGNVWLFVRVADEFFLFDWRQAQTCEEWTANDWRKRSIGYWSGTLDASGLYRIILKGASNGLG